MLEEEFLNSFSRPVLGSRTSRVAGERWCFGMVCNVQMLFWGALVSLFAVV